MTESSIGEGNMIDYIKLSSAQRDELQNAMKKVMKCRSKDRPDLDSVEVRVAHFGDKKERCLFVTATDGHRLSTIEVLHDETSELQRSFSVIIDCGGVEKLTKKDREMLESRGLDIPDGRTDADKVLGAEELYVSIKDNSIRVTLPSVSSDYFEVIHSSGSFPDWRQIIPRDHAQWFSGEKKELAKLAREIEKRVKGINKDRRANRKVKIDGWKAEIEEMSEVTSLGAPRPLSAASEKKLKGLRSNIANCHRPFIEETHMSIAVLGNCGMLEVGTVEGQAHVEAASGPGAVRTLRTFVGGINTLSDVKIGLNAAYVKDALRVMYTNNLTIEMNGQLDPVVFTDGKSKVVVMPVRL
jgi:DNA polymerase III sliding clamp (beta) subunit (PCNA family)